VLYQGGRELTAADAHESIHAASVAKRPARV